MSVAASGPAGTGLQKVPMPVPRGGPAAAAGAGDASIDGSGAFGEALDSSIATATGAESPADGDDTDGPIVPVPVDVPIADGWWVARAISSSDATAADAAGDGKKAPGAAEDAHEHESAPAADDACGGAGAAANGDAAIGAQAPPWTRENGSPDGERDEGVHGDGRGSGGAAAASAIDRVRSRAPGAVRSEHGASPADPAAGEAPRGRTEPAGAVESALRAGNVDTTAAAAAVLPEPTTSARAAHAPIDAARATSVDATPTGVPDRTGAQGGAPASIAEQEGGRSSLQIAGHAAPSAAAEERGDAGAEAASGRPRAFDGFGQSAHSDTGDRPSHERPQEAPAIGRASALTLVAAPDGTLRLTGSAPAESPAPRATADEHAENLGRLIQTFRLQIRDGISEATIRLRPEHLGEVTLAVRVDGRAVSAVVHAESASVREWLQAQESTIRGSLVEHGLHLERLHVERDPQPERREQERPRPRRTRPGRGDGAPRFEITV